jgi:DNA-binding MarR family transcriptional regulator
VSDSRLLATADSVQALAEFRHQLRIFLQFSETAARKSGLEPQQHQLLLQIAGKPDGVSATIAYAATRLGLCHNTVVELSNRCVDAGLIVRRQVASDRRCVNLQLTAEGRRVLTMLSVAHARELNELAPHLIRTLKRLRVLHGTRRKRTARRTSGR